VNEQKKTSNGKNKRQTTTGLIKNMEASLLVLVTLILVFGAVATKAVIKQSKRSDRR
jgi:hypothetical protein